MDLFRSLPSEVEPILASSFDVRPFVELSSDIEYEFLNLPQPPPSRGNVLHGLLQLFRSNLRPWAKAVQQLVKKYRPAIIHANNGLLINAGAAFAGWRMDIPVVGNQKCVEYSGRLNSFFARRGWYAHHIASSEPMAVILRDLGVPAERLSVVYEPIFPPAEPFEPRFERAGNPADPVIIGMCSMITPWKGQDVFLEAVRILRSQTATPFRVVVAGSSPANDDAYQRLLLRMVRESNLDDVVSFPGHVRDMYSYLPTLDVSVHASVKPEPFGRIVAESMVCGLPVVATRAGGPGDYVHDGEFGYTVPMSDAEAMAGAIRRLVESPALRDRFGRAGRAFALEHFSPAVIGEKTMEIYRQTLRAASR